MSARRVNLGPGLFRRQRLGREQRTAEGYFWQVTGRNRRNNTIYVKCMGERGDPCPATGRFVDHVFHNARDSRPHLHRANAQITRINECWERLYNIITKSILPIRTVFDEIMSEYRDLNGEIVYDEVRATLERWQRDAEYPNVETFTAFQRLLQSEEWRSMLRHGRGTMHVNTITTRNGNSALIIGDPTVPASIDSIATIHISQMSRMRVQFAATRHLLAVTAEYHHRAFPFAFILAADVDQELLTEVLRHVRREYLPGQTEIQTVYTHMNDLCRTAVATVWPEVTIGTTFHNLVLSLFHQAENMGISTMVEDHVIILKKLALIALLPAEQIEVNFQALCDSLTRDLIAVFNGFIIWYNNSFIGDIGPHNFSMYQNGRVFHILEKKITTRFLTKTPTLRPTIWEFYEACAGVVIDAKSDIYKIHHGTADEVRNISMSPKFDSYVSMRLLRTAWHRLASRSTNGYRFLAVACHQFRTYFDGVIFNEDWRTGLFQFTPRNNPNRLLELNHVGIPRDLQRVRLVLQWEQFLALAAEESENEEGGGENEGAGGAVAAYDWRCCLCENRPLQYAAKPCLCVILCNLCSVEAQDNQHLLDCPQCGDAVVEIVRVYIEANDRPGDGDPYDWRCAVCLEPRRACFMGLTCLHLAYCRPCARQLTRNARAAGRLPTCSICRVETRLVEVRIRTMQM